MTRPKRMTEKQLAANRANAQKSTGPRTPEGRAVSRWNALRHGLLSEALIPPPLKPYESRADFDALLYALRRDFEPATAMEDLLVQRIAAAYWRLARLLRAEAGAIARSRDSVDSDLFKRDRELDYYARRWPQMAAPRLVDRFRALYAAMSDVERLRPILAGEFEDDVWKTAPDDRVLAAAREHLVVLERALDRETDHELARAHAQRSIPPLSSALVFARYEAALDRQLSRALDALERLQRRRAGEPVSPPLTAAPPDPDA